MEVFRDYIRGCLRRALTHYFNDQEDSHSLNYLAITAFHFMRVNLPDATDEFNKVVDEELLSRDPATTLPVPSLATLLSIYTDLLKNKNLI